MKTLLTTMRKGGAGYRKFLIFNIFASIGMSVGLVFMNRFIGDVSEATLIGDIGEFTMFLVFVTGIMIARAIISTLSTLFIARFSAKNGYNLRRHFINHFLRIPFSDFEKTNSGENLSVYSNDIPKAEEFISSRIAGLIADVASFAAAIVFLIFISPSLTGIVFLSSIAMFVIMSAASIPINLRSGKMSEKEAEFNSIVNDSLQNLSVVSAYSLEEVLEKRYMDSYYHGYYAAMKRLLRAMVPIVIVALFVKTAPMAVAYAVLGFAVISGDMSLAEFVAFIATLTYVFDGASFLVSRIAGTAEAAARAKRFNDSTSESLEDTGSGESLGNNAAASISFEDVSFSYSEEGDPALECVSFSIPHGARVAVVGESGSGKSTVLKLLMGLYEPQSGRITINGTDMSALSKRSVCETFAYMPQDSFLFPQSIARNIAAGEKAPDYGRLEMACRDAGIMQFIDSLPERFGHVMEEDSENVSGGQRQRISMARAFYKNAPAILFDEATSSLDTATEASILESFGSATKNKTVIMVAHRMAAIAVCETIIVMDGGKVSGMGSHENLMLTNDIYRKFYDMSAKEIKPLKREVA